METEISVLVSTLVFFLVVSFVDSWVLTETDGVCVMVDSESSVEVLCLVRVASWVVGTEIVLSETKVAVDGLGVSVTSSVEVMVEEDEDDVVGC